MSGALPRPHAVCGGSEYRPRADRLFARVDGAELDSGAPMITGFNTDIKHGDKVYHIQTEDKGLANPFIESLVYVGGEILASKKTSYAEQIKGGGADEKWTASRRLPSPRRRHSIKSSSTTSHRKRRASTWSCRFSTRPTSSPERPWKCAWPRVRASRSRRSLRRGSR